MLVTMNAVLDYAEANNQAIGAFNVCSLEGIQAVLEAAEEQNQPVILQFAPGHEEYISLDTIGPVMVLLAEQSTAPVCVHLDHGDSIARVKKALELGFTSVMYDGSTLPFDQNVANTRMAVEIADEYGASVEAEIGAMSGTEGTMVGHESSYTDPEEAKLFVDLTGVDALACSFGTVHGLYAAEPNLDFERISKIREIADIPVVMHGGSGVSEADFKECINRGVRKINYYTYAAKAAGAAVKEYCNSVDGVVYFHDIMTCGREALKKDILGAMKIFSNK